MNEFEPSKAETGVYFGVEIVRSTPEIADLPPAESAAQSLARAIRDGDGERIYEIETSVRQLSSIIEIEEERDGVTMRLTDLFTAEQLIEMNRRVATYLGVSLDTHIAKPARPVGYPFYINRLGFHFASHDDDITRSFGAFEQNHENPGQTAHGPYESNSRDYAIQAIGQMLRQFEGYYQTGMKIRLLGPTKVIDGSRLPERGIAESQFLILDYVRDLLAQENATKARTYDSEIMTVSDIEANILALVGQRNTIVSDVSAINPFIANQLKDTIERLNRLTVSVMHRGRPGVPMFRRDPNKARRLLANAEMLLMQATAMAETKPTEEEIPILDL